MQFLFFRSKCLNMKKFTLLSLIILLSLAGFAQQWNSVRSETPAPIRQRLIEAQNDQIVVQFSIDGFYTNFVNTPKGKAAIVSVPKMVSLSEKGAPDVPKFAVSAIIGDDAMMDVKIISSKYLDIESIDVAPSKGDFSRKIDPATVPYTYGSMYQQDAFYPTANALLQEPYILRNFRGQALTIHPFVYNPVSKTLRVFYDITVEIYRTGTGGENQLVRSSALMKEDPEFSHIYSNHFINYGQAQTRYPVLQEQGNLLIISHGPYMEAMQPFVQWKKTIGRHTQIVDVSMIGTTPQAIKDYVLNYYNTNGLTHLLLVGDHQHVPSFNNTTAGGFSDYFYGYLAGNDSYNEVFVGRFSSESVADVQNQVAKVIAFERDLDHTATWLSIGTGVARNEGAGNGHNGGESDYVHMDYIRDSLLNYTYTTVYREYDGGVPGLPNTTAAQISQRINAGTSLINYCNHGSQTGWSVAGYATSHVNALTNVGKHPIVWAVACDNGRFTNGTCFAESWMRATHNGQPAGALGTMMSWISQPWQPPMTGQDEMVTILVESYQNNIKRTFGGVSINGSMKMIDLHGTSGRSTHDTWIMFGDPSMTMRTTAPVAMNVQHMPAIFLGMSEFTVNADAEGAIVALTIDGEIIGTGYINNGSTTITFPALNNVGNLKIAVFGYNKVTYINEIEIIPASGPFVAYMSNLVNGLTGGQVHYAQDVVLGIQLKNLGVEPASNIVATLSTTSPFVTITDNQQEFGTINPSDVSMITDAFAFTVADNVPNNTAIQFTITMVSDQDTWSTNFNLTALAPAFSIGNYVVLDPAGNGNGRLDPGETAEIKVSFTNSGSSQAANGLAGLVFNSPFVTVNSSAVEYTTIETGQAIDAVFNITVNGGAPIGQAVTFDFSIQAGAYSAQKSFSAKVGLILEDFESGNFSSFPWTFAGNLPWTITTVNPYEGSFSAKSGAITHSQSSQMSLQYQVSVNDTISFFRRVSSESGYDFLRFYIDNTKVAEWAGNIPWSKVSFPVQAGNRTFRWEYMKDYIVSSGEDCAWIDYITLPPTIVTTGWAGTNASICAGDTHQLDGMASHYTALAWTTTGTGTFNNPAILNPIYTPSEADILAGSVSLKLTVTGNTSTVQSTKTLTINPLALSFAGDDGFVCAGSDYVVTLAEASNYSSLLWTSSGSGTFDDAALLNPVYTPSAEDLTAGQVTLTLTAIGIGSCAANSSSFVAGFHVLPSLLISGDQTVCAGSAAEISFELTGQAPWLVEMADGLGTVEVPSSPFVMQHTPEQAHTYTALLVKDANNCEAVPSGHAIVQLNFVPVAPLKPSAPDTVDHAFVTSSNISIQATANTQNYQWMVEPAEAGTISGEGTGITIAWNASFTGIAKIKAAGSNDCGQGEWSEEKEVLVRSTIGVAEFSAANIQVYPNPSNGYFNLDIQQLAGQNVSIKVTNLIGELVYFEQAEANNGKFSKAINLSHLNAGVYIISVESNQNMAVQRITIRK